MGRFRNELFGDDLGIGMLGRLVLGYLWVDLGMSDWVVSLLVLLSDLVYVCLETLREGLGTSDLL